MKLSRGSSRPSSARLVGCIVGMAMIIGCSATSPSAISSTAPSVARTAVTPTPVTPATSPPIASERPACPNGGGGVCLGPLDPGTYSSEEFDPRITYTVPAGWGNYEDLIGNFLLLPPGSDLDGVDAGTSDYLGIYSSVGLAAPCVESAPDAKGPAAMAAYIAGHREFATSHVHTVTVGGLRGVALDIKLAPTWTKACIDPAGGPAANLITGLPPSSLDHGIGGPLRMRLYLLSHDPDVIAIELDDVFSGGRHLDTLDEVVKSVRFG